MALIGLMEPFFMMASAQRMDSVRTEVIVEGLEGRPILIAERMPLTGALRPVKGDLHWAGWTRGDGVAGRWAAPLFAVGLRRVNLAASDGDGLAGGHDADSGPAGSRAVCRATGYRPFGGRAWDRDRGAAVPIPRGIGRGRVDAAVAWQKQWLRGDAARGNEAEVLGGRIGEEEEVPGEAVPKGALAVLDSLTVAASEGATDAVAHYLEAVRWRTELDLPGTNLDSARRTGNRGRP